jgi:hypothetical protein
MSRPTLLTAIVGALLVGLVLSSSIFQARAVTSYTPAVSTGQWAKYKVLSDKCTFLNPFLCKTFGPGAFMGADSGLLQVVMVSGTSVTLSLTVVYANGTTSNQGLKVDVAAGTTNASGVLAILGDRILLAGGLIAPDPIWSSALAPTLNRTINENVLGASRDVNFLNQTFSTTLYGVSVSFKLGFAFDQASGLFTEISVYYSIPGQYGGSVDFSIGMADNDIWLTPPDFGVNADPTTVNIVQGGSGTSTISVTRLNGLSTGVSLTAIIPSAAITCYLSSSLATMGYDTSTLSCSGSSGSYTVIVRANASYLIRTLSVTVNVDPHFTISSSGAINLRSGDSGTATITITAVNGYSSTTDLEVSSTPSGLTCNLNSNSVSGYGSVILTCSGQPGSYMVTVKASGGGSSQSTQTAVTVTPATVQPASILPLPVVYGGIAGAAFVALFAAAVLLKRRPGRAHRAW